MTDAQRPISTAAIIEALEEERGEIARRGKEKRKEERMEVEEEVGGGRMR